MSDDGSEVIMDDNGVTEQSDPAVTEDGDGDTVIDLSTAAPDDSPEEIYNLVPLLMKTKQGKKFLETAADTVLADTKRGWESTEDYREKRRQLYKLYRGFLDPKSEPFEDCANVHLPIVLKAISMLEPRIMTQLFPNDDYIYVVEPTGPEDNDRSEMLTTFGDWELKHEQVDFIPNMEMLLTEILLIGSGFVHSYRDTLRNRNCHEFLSCEEFIIPYVWKTTDPSLGDVPYKVRIIRKYRHELERLAKQGYYSNLEEVFETDKEGKIQRKAPDDGMDLELTVREEVDEFEGKKKPDDDPNAPYVLFEWHGWLTMPGEDEDRPVKVTLERSTKKVIGFSMAEQDDWKDKERFDTQMMEYQQYQDAIAQFRESVNNPQVVLDPQSGQPMKEPPPNPPLPPEWAQTDDLGEVQPPEKPKKVPIEMFTHAVCAYDPHSSMGIGVGDMVLGFNMIGNQVANQFIDSATLYNDSPMIASENSLPPGNLDIKPGLIIRSPLPPDQIKGAMQKLFEGQANPQLMEIVHLMMEVADQTAATPDVFSGEAGKANETYRGIATRVEQATKPLTAIALRALRGITEIIKKNARLNSVFRPEQEVLNVVDPTKGRTKVTISRSMFLEDFDITFTADTRFVSKAQKVEEDNQLLGMGAQSPLFAGNPFQQKVWLYQSTVQLLKDMNRPNMIPFLGPPPQPPPPPQPIPPHQENAGFLQGQTPAVNPQDDDTLHVQDHQTFMQSNEGQHLDPQQRKNLEQHVRNHVAQTIMKRAQQMGVPNAQGSGMGGGGPGGPASPPGQPGIQGPAQRPKVPPRPGAGGAGPQRPDGSPGQPPG